jgi:phosphoglycerate kinase
MNRLLDLPADALRGKRVLVRAGFDVPLDAHGEVGELFRIERALPTLVRLREAGAKTIILSHIGRDPEESNEPVAKALARRIPVTFIPDLLGALAHDAINAMREGDIVLLENLRRDPRETKNDDTFAKELSTLGDIYVGDAFSAAHRAHASIVGIPKYLPHYAGLLLCAEVDQLSAARTPSHPSVAILGGAKFETKAPLISTLLATYDTLFITGALANDIHRARGLSVGASLISKEAPSAEVLANPHLLAPIDMTVQEEDGHAIVKHPQDIKPTDKIVDIGPDSLALLAPKLEAASFILWNGPTGLYEAGFTAWTHAIAEVIARRVAAGAKSIIGGGDTIAAIDGAGISHEQLGFVSTGGGAMLEYLLDGTLPGIEALN